MILLTSARFIKFGARFNFQRRWELSNTRSGCKVGIILVKENNIECSNWGPTILILGVLFIAPPPFFYDTALSSWVIYINGREIRCVLVVGRGILEQ